MRKLNDLDFDEFVTAVSKNTGLKDQLWSNGEIECCYFVENEILHYFRHYDSERSREVWSISDYNFGYPGNHVEISEYDFTRFVEDFADFDSEQNVLDFEERKILVRLLQKADLFDEVVGGYCEEPLKEKDADRFTEWFYNGVDMLKDALIRSYSEAESYYSDEDYLMQEAYEMNYFDDDIVVDDDLVAYQTTTRCFA